MIDSAYWKMRLSEAAEDIGRLQDGSRWVPDPNATIEHELMLAMFSVRCLIERQKLSEALISKPIDVIACPKRTGQQVTRLNCHEVTDLYDFEQKKKKECKTRIFVQPSDSQLRRFLEI